MMLPEPAVHLSTSQILFLTPSKQVEGPEDFKNFKHFDGQLQTLGLNRGRFCF